MAEQLWKRRKYVEFKCPKCKSSDHLVTATRGNKGAFCQECDIYIAKNGVDWHFVMRNYDEESKG